MKRITLGKTGLRVSSLGFGAAPIGYLDTDLKQVRRVLEALLDEGVNVLDRLVVMLGHPGRSTQSGGP